MNQGRQKKEKTLEEKLIAVMVLSMVNNSQATVDEIFDDLGVSIEHRTEVFRNRVLGQSLLVFDRVIELAREKEGVVNGQTKK